MRRPIAAGLLLANTLPALAISFDLGPVGGRVTSDFTVGATWRVEDRDPALVGKGNLQPGLCTGTTHTDNPGGPLTPPEYFTAADYESRGLIGATCNDTTDPSLNLAYVQAPGSYNVNGDNGNLNFDRYDVVASAAKLSSRFNVYWKDFALQGRGIWFFDQTYVGFDEFHPDTTLQERRSPLDAEAVDLFGTAFDLTELFVSTFVPVGDRTLSLRAGRHGLNWGESTALPLNSINTVNPPDLRRTRIPGSSLDELFRPVGMVSAAIDLSLNLAAEAFYQYEWLPALIDAPGTYYSTSDILGGDPNGGSYGMLSFGKAPEDPFSIYASQDNGEDPFSLGSASSRTIYRIADNEPDDGGQYGLSLRYFAENFNNGTEFALYFANYHSRIPSASFRAAAESCAADATNLVTLAIGCGVLQGDIGTLMLAEEPLPVDTVRVFADYPEDIQMYGVSFNTNIGDWAWSGEYAYRPNMPLQIHTVDLIFAALQPAFPRNNINIGLPDPAALAPLPPELLGPLVDTLAGGGVPATVLPGRRVAVPDYVQTLYRNDPVQPLQIIQGYERVKLGQLTSTLIRTFGAANPLKATQIAVVLEAGITHVIDMPALGELQFQGAESNTHASNGADGTRNALPDSATIDSDGDGDTRCQRQAYDSIGGAEAEPCRQNPTAENPDAFGDDIAYGLRAIGVTRYQNAFLGANLDIITGVFWDIGGIAPGVGQNFQEGNIQSFVGLNLDYLSRYTAELRYTYYDGDRNARRDRDTLGLTLRYSF